MNMSNELKEILNQVQATEELKARTRAFLAEKTQGYTKRKTEKRRRSLCAAACACLLLLLAGGYWLYFIPTAAISIDINPSIELSINRFDQVISVSSFNEDGQELLKSLDIKFKNYEDAIQRILDSDEITTLLSHDEIMTITVTGPEGLQSAKILSELEACTAEQENAYCYFASSEEAAAAHEMGLSCGKYRAYLEVQALDPDITAEAVQGMTMREIRELVDCLSAGEERDPAGCGSGGNGPSGYGGGHSGSGRSWGKTGQ